MDALRFLVAWYNLPFLAALFCFLVCAALQLFAGSDDDTAAEHDVADLAAEGDAPAADANHVGLAALGFGRLPLTLVLMAFLGSFGTLGLLGNSLLHGLLGGYPAWLFVVVLLVGGVGALLLTGVISRVLVRLTPRHSAAIRLEELVGRSGRVTTATVSGSYGRVEVRDKFGGLHTVFAVTEGGELLPEQSEVALVAY
ncbi:MAG: YqiJ family protein, partial [Chloroflexaceae bacterium]|nr:YqiJ family protein [Chloroflexaceae bacterium]